MPTDYTPVPTTYYEVIPLPLDSDLRNSVAFNGAYQPLANNIAYLKTNTVSGLGGVYDPTAWISFIGHTNHKGMVFAVGSTLWFDTLGILKVGNGANVQGVTGSWWSGVYPFVGATIDLDATSTLRGETTGTGPEIAGYWLIHHDALITQNGIWVIDGGELRFLTGSTCNVQSGSVWTFETGSTVGFKGTVTGDPTGAWGGTFKYSGATIEWDTTTTVACKGVFTVGGSVGSTLAMASNSTFEIQSGAAEVMKAGSWRNIEAGANVNNSGTIASSCGYPSLPSGHLARSLFACNPATYAYNFTGIANQMPELLLVSSGVTTTITLPAAGAFVGQEVTVSVAGAASAQAHVTGGGITPVTMTNVSSGITRVTFVWTGTVWWLLGWDLFD